MNIIQRTSTVHTGSLRGRAILYIVLHYTAGTRAKTGTARNVAAMFANPNNRAASADFIVDEGEIVQYNGDIQNRYTYAVGGNAYSVRYTPLAATLYGRCKNSNSISIEMCSVKVNTSSLGAEDADWSIPAAVVDKAVELTRYLMQKYNIPAERVIMHHHVTGKLCPQPWCLNTKRLEQWEAFKARLNAEKEEEQDMTEKEVKTIVENLTDEAAYHLYEKAMRYLASQPEPEWSREEGAWGKAKERGVVDGTRPTAPITRAEHAATLARLGLL